jgi:hypothetical protein
MALDRSKKGSGGARVSFRFNTSSLQAGLRRLIDQVEPTVTARGLFAAGNELLRDAIYTPPQAPKLKGALWGSARVTKANVSRGEANLLAGFNIEYAAKWHEVPLSRKINWTRDKGAGSPGPKYLESKMSANREKYMRIVGEFLLAGLQTGRA